MSEHDFEPVRGLPGELPAGERLLWQGAPGWWPLAQRAFHVRSVSAYFGVLMAWRGIATALEGATFVASVQSALHVAPIAIAAVTLLCGLAILTARTSVYTITTKRIVLRFGVALPKAINIPFTIIENAALKGFSDKTGDIALTLTQPNKIAYFLLWPHARPWKLARPEPTMRAVVNASVVAARLADALKAAHGERGAIIAPVQTSEPAAAPEAVLSPA
ncbi:photosynthetic complex putative assembly protein PuhB [Terricaulis sp.]|uniref:photosynthetic complex putative assembly protein PuhB n=1 Tax=Terricaulis sp. TaxID=2768686 RepID=UPI002AC64A33|nr:photosynthetic complex putative assembly protein PuhB [Terricaulis sp.]MDZ4691558.1 photosynthetic complex putative assembly protein PuhB [Terricaulis sp.]